ncbi:unnamed protein product [Allacma fusca]|nr:unnamed protein product [Allacma fusca]
MYNTNLFCHPASHTCSCFSWTSMKAYNVTSEIFYEDDEEIRNYLTNLGDFLAIEMEWNESLNKCQSLNGSACSVPDNLSDQFLDTYYVSCYPGLACVAVQDEGFVIGRCMQLSAELEYLHEHELGEKNQNDGNKMSEMDDIVVEVAMEKSEDISAIV